MTTEKSPYSQFTTQAKPEPGETTFPLIKSYK